MKPIIIISAYCPDDERKQLLENCINSLQPIRKDFDILISTHAYIPEYIGKKVDFVFYDANNDLIYDWDLINTPWFSPHEGLTIVSSLVSNFSTYSACNRIIMGGLGIAKNFGYKKAHYIDYDTIINDPSEFYDNNTLLDNYVTIQYKKEYKNYQYNVEGGVLIFHSVNLNKINKIFTTYNEKELLKILKEAPNKTNEIIYQDLYKLDGEEILYKDFDILLNQGNIFNQSRSTQKDDLNDWTVPYYDTKTNKINVIAWNSKKDYPINVSFIINQEKIITLNNVNKFEWKIDEIDDIDNINEILIIVDNKIKNHVLINTPELKEKFKRNNQTQYK
jgi:hypothetical protein